MPSTLGLAQQASTSIADSGKITISAWVKYVTEAPPDAEGLYIPVVFAGVTSEDVLDVHGISLGLRVNSESDINQVQFKVSGRSLMFDSDDVHEIISGDPAAAFPAEFDGANQWQPCLDCGIDLLIGSDEYAAVAPDTWFHLFVSLDLDNDTSRRGLIAGDPVYTSGPKLSVAINGTVLDPWNGDSSQPEELFFAFCNGPGTNPAGSSSLPSTAGNGTDNYRVVTPPFQIPISGYKLGVPTTDDAPLTDVSTDVVMCGVLIWTGQYIDPRSASTNFVHGSLAAPTMVPVEVAIEAYGQPQFVGDGDDATFAANSRGAAGAFTLVNETYDDSSRPTSA
jgi:hypothetical protein